MAIGIIGAMQQEVAILKALIDVNEVIDVMHVEFTVGTLHGKDVVLLESGIGKVNVAVATTLLIERFDIEYVINTGSAGGLTQDAQVGDVVISENVAHHDVDVRIFGYEAGQIPGMPAIFAADTNLVAKVEAVLKAAHVRHFKGQIVTGDTFVHRPEQMMAIQEHFNHAVALEMEAAAVAQVCYLAKVPFVVVRALSDIAGKESDLSFTEFLPLAAKASSEMVEQLVKVI
ncbi:MAG: 5'-methylthioadenosine/S-adenosylhomocysteine nucleosidase [Turicibacter sp.]|nr:5'-methylthioadenosine/S-adenosylhomocysteine nucleosidase [Turicibacter sp.]